MEATNQHPHLIFRDIPVALGINYTMDKTAIGWISQKPPHKFS
jgi:hypothetical protein